MRIAWQVFAGPYVCLDKPLRNRRGMDLMQDVVTSHNAHTTLSLLQAHRVNILPWPSKLPDLNPIKHNLGCR